MNSVRNLKRNSLLVVAFFIATFFTFATTNYEAKAKVDFSHTAKVDGIAYQHYRNIDDATGALSLFTVWLDVNGNFHRKDSWLYSNTNSSSTKTEKYYQKLSKNFKKTDNSNRDHKKYSSHKSLKQYKQEKSLKNKKRLSKASQKTKNYKERLLKNRKKNKKTSQKN